MSERRLFVQECLRGEESTAELCRRYGISRKTGYKWLNRYLSDARDESLKNRSRRPRRSPRAVEAWLEELIVNTRKQRPRWGPKKLRAVLGAMNPRLELPSVSTIAAILKRNGLVKPRRRRRRVAPFSSPLAHATEPNAVWCVDFKGHFATGSARCHPLTIMDAHSRYLIACVGLGGTTTRAVRRVFEGVFDEFGLPRAIRSDNGEPFASRAPAGLSQLSAWWLKLGIRHERIEPGHPEQNGRHERMHLTLKQETAMPPASSRIAQQRRFDLFRADYNDRRPHEALEQQPPALFYEPSSRRLPRPHWGRDFTYPEDFDNDRVNKSGWFTSHAGAFFVSTVLYNELLGIYWRDPKHADLYFGPLLLGQVTRRSKRPRRVTFDPTREVLPMSLDDPLPMSSD